MAGFIFLGVCILVVSVLRGMQSAAKEGTTPPPLPSPVGARRLRQRAPKVVPPAVGPATSPVVVATAPVHQPAPVVAMALPRYGHHAIRGEFATRAALRRAIIAQEVLGPPLSLRSPRD